MAGVDAAATMAAVRRKLNVSWSDSETDERLQDVVDTVSPRLASLVGYPQDHEFSKDDGQAWGLFLNGCLYEYSDAWDDFASNYAREITSIRLHMLGSVEDAQTQG